MPIVRTPQEAGPRLDAGTYEMVVTNVREGHIDNSQFGTGDIIRFTLQTSDEYEPIELEAIANDSLTPLSKLTRWLNALGVGVTPGVPLDLEAAKGRKCLANVILDDKGEKGVFNKVADLVAPPTARRATREALAPSAGHDDEEPQGEADVRLASPKQVEFVGRLLSDLGLDYADFARELNLPDNAAQMRVPDLQRAVDTLQDRKKALATK